MNSAHDHTTAIGTAAGGISTLIFNISTDDIVKTIVLGAIGSVVGFMVTTALKWLVKKIKQ